MSRSYYYKGFMFSRGLCGSHPDMWTIMDWRDYNPQVGAKPTNTCEPTIKTAKEAINNLLFVEANIPF